MKLHYALLLGALALGTVSCSSKKDDPRPLTPQEQPLQLKDATYNVASTKTTPEKITLPEVGEINLATLNVSEAVLATGPIKTIAIKGDQITFTGDLGNRTYSINAESHEIYRPATAAMPGALPVGMLAMPKEGEVAVTFNIFAYPMYKMGYQRRQKAAGKEMDPTLAAQLDALGKYKDPKATENTSGPSMGFTSSMELQGTIAK